MKLIIQALPYLVMGFTLLFLIGLILWAFAFRRMKRDPEFRKRMREEIWDRERDSRR